MASAVVTGATGGLGRWIALGLSGAGLRVLMIGRNPDRLERTADWIAGRTGSRPDIVRADLSLLADTRRAAAQVLARVPALDVLVANAGILSHRRVETAEGHELTLAVNHLSPFVLSRALLPALRAAPMGRIVLTGSSTADRGGLDPADLELRRDWRMTRAYARSKLAQQICALELAARERRVSVNVVHPGLVATGLVRQGGIDGLVWRGLSRVALTAAEGAAAPLRAALSPALAGISGAYLKRDGLAPANRRTRDPALRARVLEATLVLVRDPAGPG